MIINIWIGKENKNYILNDNCQLTYTHTDTDTHGEKIESIKKTEKLKEKLFFSSNTNTMK